MSASIKKSIPSIYTIEGDGSPKGWGWTNLAELCEIAHLNPTDLFNRYSKLSSGRKDGTLAVYNIGVGYDTYPATDFPYMERILTQLYSEPGQSNWAIDQWLDRTFVPTGWATAVLDEISGVARDRRVKRAHKYITDQVHQITCEIRHDGYSHSLWFTPKTKEAGIAKAIARQVVQNWTDTLVQFTWTATLGEFIGFVDPRKYDLTSVPAGPDRLDQCDQLVKTDAWRQLGSPKPWSDSPTYFIRVNVK